VVLSHPRLGGSLALPNAILPNAILPNAILANIK